MLPRQQASQYIGGYVSVRNDATLLSIAERNLIISTSTESNTNHAASFRSIDNENLYMRVDGRKRTERRPISIQLIRHHDNPTDASSSSCSHSSTTTATVTLGAGTRVTCTVTSELVAPMIDRPNDGILSFSIDISPSANTSYRYATPASTYNLGASSSTTASNLPNADRHQKIISNHILRTLERCFVQPGGAIDTEALCVVPGDYVWKIHCACTILDDSGNIIDASVLACIAAIRHYRQPVVELVSSSNSQTGNATTNTVATPIIIPSHIKEPTPLPLLHTPITISFAFIVNNNTASSISNSPKLGILIDPTNHEELCSRGRITIGMNVYKEICFFDVTTGYNCELHLHDIQYCYAVAESSEHIASICQILESSLSDADELDRNQRLLQIKQQQQQQQLPLPPPTGVILRPGEDDEEDDDRRMDTETQPIANTEEEEEDLVYRRRALDFTIGHVASKVRENNYEEKGNNSKEHGASKATNKDTSKSNTLLESMLRSLNQQPPRQGEIKVKIDDPSNVAMALTTVDAATDDGDNVDAAAVKHELMMDDDEEDDVMELKSEFVTKGPNIPAKKSTKKKRKR